VDNRFGFDPATVFDPVATDYRDVRPGYPDALYDSLQELVGALRGKAVADLGAGTGIATSALAARGATVLAVDPSLAMLGPTDLPSVSAQAEELPLRSASQDLLTCAQAWHWVEPIRAVPECSRVLTAGGHLALWWNISDSGARWLGDIESVSGLRPYGVGSLQDDPATLTAGGLFSGVEYRDLSWHWTVPIDRWLRVASTRSSSVTLVREGGSLPMKDLQTVLYRHFPGGEVTEAFTCHLTVATRI
jgi:SAM-dependent methyltransferase